MNDEKPKQTLRGTISSTKFMFMLVWGERGGKKLIFMKILMAAVGAVFPVIFTVFPGLIINELTYERRVDVLVLYIGVLVATPLAQGVINWATDLFIRRVQWDIDLGLRDKYLTHSARMDYELLEDPKIQILKEHAGHTFWDAMEVINQLSQLVSAVFRVLALGVIISMLSPLIIILVAGIVLINSQITKHGNNRLFVLQRETRAYHQRRWLSNSHLNNFNFAKDLRLFGTASMLIKLFVNNTMTLNNRVLNEIRARGVLGLIGTFLNFLQEGAVYAYAVFSVLVHGLAIGSMTIYLAAARQLSETLSLVSRAYLDMGNRSLYIKEMQEFMAIPQKQYESGTLTPTLDKNSVIEFKNVSFKYPGSENFALKNLSLTLRGNEKLCIVGANGSGKSTFIKLLTRLYMPAEGEITLNGINIYEYDYVQYQRLFSPAFQDGANFHYSLGQNIAMASDYDEKKLDEVCAKCGLTELVKKLPKGYDTMTDKNIEEDGIIPSGGELQRIFIARALYHGAPMYLLDEPTAALDPIMEYEIYTQFNNMITESAAILITHRLSAVKLADKVAVFEGGAVVEYGTHQELYERHGTYADMYEKQAEFYIKGE